MFTFKSGAPVMDFTNSDLWNGGLGTRRQTSLLSTDVWEGGHLILHTEEPTCHLTQQPCPWHGGCNSPPPDFIPHLSPDLAPSFFLEECFFWSPFWLSLFKTTADNWVWRLRLPLSAFPPGFPSSDEELFSAWLWNQPITKGAWWRTFQSWVTTITTWPQPGQSITLLFPYTIFLQSIHFFVLYF